MSFVFIIRSSAISLHIYWLLFGYRNHVLFGMMIGDDFLLGFSLKIAIYSFVELMKQLNCELMLILFMEINLVGLHCSCGREFRIVICLSQIYLYFQIESQLRVCNDSITQFIFLAHKSISFLGCSIYQNFWHALHLY